MDAPTFRELRIKQEMQVPRRYSLSLKLQITLVMNFDELSRQVAAGYGFTGSLACRLLRSHTNDVFDISASGRHFALKIYGENWRTESEIRYEIALVQHLRTKGLPVATPVSTRDNDSILNIETPMAYRHAVLFNYAPGEKPQPPFSPDLYYRFGRSIARMHQISNGFTSTHQRRPLNLEYLIDEPLTLLVPLLEESADREFLKTLSGQVKSTITTLAFQGLDWGPIHGDATLDNLHITANGEITLYDFDSGGPGWRAADLQGWAINNSDHELNWKAFSSGYSSIKPLNPIDLLAAPYLTLAWDLWGIKIDLERRIMRKGQAKIERYLSERLAEIRQRSHTIN